MQLNLGSLTTKPGWNSFLSRARIALTTAWKLISQRSSTWTRKSASTAASPSRWSSMANLCRRLTLDPNNESISDSNMANRGWITKIGLPCKQTGMLDALQKVFKTKLQWKRTFIHSLSKESHHLAESDDLISWLHHQFLFSFSSRTHTLLST